MHAQVCLEVDAQRDTLTEGEREQALGALRRAFEQNGHTLLAPGCQVNFRVYNARLEGRITIVLSSASDSRSTEVDALGDLPGAYDGLVRALLPPERAQPQAPSQAPAAQVTPSPKAPPTDSAQLENAESSLAYARLGTGGTFAGKLYPGLALGVGYRYERGRFGVQLSAFDLALPGLTFHDLSGSLAALGGSYRPAPLAQASLYGTLALGYSKTVQRVDADFTGSGLAADLALGYEWDRQKRLRWLLQADASLPFYTLDSRGIARAHSYWAPAFALSVGVGFETSDGAR